MLNKDARESVETRVDIQDWPCQDLVEIHEVQADSYLAENTIAQPDTVTLADPQILRLMENNKLAYRLKPNSLAVLCLKRKSVD